MSVFEVSCPKCKNSDFYLDEIADFSGSILKGEIFERWYCHCEECGHSFVADVVAETKITKVTYSDNDW